MDLDFIRAQSEKLKEMLLSVDLSQFDAYGSDFAGYVRVYQDTIDGVLPRYVDLIHRTCRHRSADMSFLDFGGGTGILSFLAKLCGISFVCYMDFDRNQTEGSRKLAEHLRIPVDDFITGSYEGIETTCTHRFDVIADYDVLEHVYSPEQTFLSLKRVLKPGGEVCMASGANTMHPVISIICKRRHRLWEELGSSKRRAHLDTRRDIIREAFPDMATQDLELLARSTRGLRRGDILAAASLYRERGMLTRPAPGTNTCDPADGNWAENLMDFLSLAERLRIHFRSVDAGPGLYSPVRPRITQAVDKPDDPLVKLLYPSIYFAAMLLSPLSNLLIRALPYRLKFMVAPYYYIHAKAE